MHPLHHKAILDSYSNANALTKVKMAKSKNEKLVSPRKPTLITAPQGVNRVLGTKPEPKKQVSRVEEVLKPQGSTRTETTLRNSNKSVSPQIPQGTVNGTTNRTYTLNAPVSNSSSDPVNSIVDPEIGMPSEENSIVSQGGFGGGLGGGLGYPEEEVVEAGIGSDKKSFKSYIPIALVTIGIGYAVFKAYKSSKTA